MVCNNFPGENSITIKGMTYNLAKNGEVKASKLKQSKIKFTDSTNCYKIAEFDLPDVVPGSLIEYKISIPTLDLVSPKSWYFQSEIQCLHSEFRMRIPVQFNYLISPQNISHFDISEESYFNQTLMYNPPYYYSRGRLNLNYNLSGKQIRLVKYNNERFDNQDFVLYPMDNIQSINIHLTRATRENMDYGWEYLTHALVITTKDDYEQYEPKQRSLIPYPAGYIYYNMTDWEKFNSKLLKSDNFGLPLIKHWEHEEILKEIIKDKESPVQQLIAIYDFIRKNMDWTGRYSIFVNSVFNSFLSKLYTKVTKKLINEKSLSKPLQKGEGSSSEINFVLIYLLNKAGIEAHPVILKTRDMGKIDTHMVESKQFNHVIACANIDNKQLFLDATDSLRPYNLLDKKDLTQQGFLVKNEDFGWMEVSNNELSKNSVTEQIDIDKELNYTSKIKISETGYFAYDQRKEILTRGKEEFKKNIISDYSAASQTQLTDIKDIDMDALPLITELSKSVNSSGSDEILIKPNFKPIYSSNDFKDEIRKYPVEFPFPFRQNYIMELNVPEGYKVELPENKSFSSYGGHAAYQYQASGNGNEIKISITLEIKLTEYPAMEYYNLAKLFTELSEQLQENIVIRK
jgi:hypothetical protein